MTYLRQFLRPLVWTLVVTGLYAGVALLIAAAGGPSQAATTERVVIDRHSGLAIHGFDPVAYFVEKAPHEGSGDYEIAWQGATWRFQSEGNRAAFMAHPEVYGPRFGGHDPVAVARGAAVAGDPGLWLVHGERLYMFHSQASLDAFARAPEPAIAAADAAWPGLERTLAK